MNLQKLLNNSFSFIIAFLLTAPLFMGCSENKKSEGYAARVNDTYLLESDVSSHTKGDSLNPASRSEYVQNWVRSEILYQKAVSEGITKDDEFNFLLDKAKKEIAATLLRKKVSDDFKVSNSDFDLKKYYDAHPDYFKINDMGFFFDQVTFSDAKKAASFRETAIARGWSIAIGSLREEKNGIEISKNTFRLDHQLESGVLFRVIHFLSENDISLVLDTAPGVYVVVRLQKVFQQGAIPPFVAMRNIVESRVLNEKRGEMMEEYIKELYDKYKVDIKGQEKPY